MSGWCRSLRHHLTSSLDSIVHNRRSDRERWLEVRGSENEWVIGRHDGPIGGNMEISVGVFLDDLLIFMDDCGSMATKAQIDLFDRVQPIFIRRPRLLAWWCQ